MEVEAMVRPVVEAAGLELVDASLVRERGRRILRVTVDREGGVDLDAIGQVSDRLNRRLDLEGFDPGPYSLEVSSPGIERPLKEPRHYARSIGAFVRVNLSHPIDGASVLEGTLVAAGADQIDLATGAGRLTVSYGDIASARTVFEWGLAGRKSTKVKGERT